MIVSLGLVILGIGLMLLGITSLRAKIPHSWRGLPLGLGSLSIMFGIASWLFSYVPLSQGRVPWGPWNFVSNVLWPAVDLLLGLGWIVLGITLAAEVYDLVIQPPASA